MNRGCYFVVLALAFFHSHRSFRIYDLGLWDMGGLCSCSGYGGSGGEEGRTFEALQK